MTDSIGTTFNSEDFDSIGGIIIELLDRFPSEGESVITEDGVELTATEVIQNRIEKVQILLPLSDSPSDEEETEEDVLPANIEEEKVL